MKSWIEGPLLGPALEALLGDALGAELGPLDCVHSKTASIRIKVTLKHIYKIDLDNRGCLLIDISVSISVFSQFLFCLV